MKKIIFSVILVSLVFVCLGCTNTMLQSSSDDRDNIVTKVDDEIKEQILEISCSYVYYDSLEDYLKQTDHVVVAKVKKILPVKRINEKEIKMTTVEDSWENFTPVELEIITSIAGDLKNEDKIELRLMGGSFKGKTEKNITEQYDLKYLEEGKTYLLFIIQNFKRK